MALTSLLTWLSWVLTAFAWVATVRAGVRRVRAVPALPGPAKGGARPWSGGTWPDGTGTRTSRPGSLPGRNVEGPSLPAEALGRATRAAFAAAWPRIDPRPPGAEPWGSAPLARAIVDC